MKIDHKANTQFNISTARPAKAQDLFLPSVIEVVRHMARMAAENDYKHFLKTGDIPYADPTAEDNDD